MTLDAVPAKTKSPRHSSLNKISPEILLIGKPSENF
jgi:hypothetical protein